MAVVDIKGTFKQQPNNKANSNIAPLPFNQFR